MVDITKRHNLIVNRLKQAAGKRCSIVRENQRVADSTLRPDLLLVKDGHALIIDATVTFENGPEAFNLARKSKNTKT